MYADQMVSASFARAVQTQDGGYIVKQYNAAFSHIALDEHGTDCRTKMTKEVVIDKGSLKDIFLRYAIYKGKEILLTSKAIQELQGQKVQLRSPLYCTSSKVCTKCAGEFYYRVGTKNIGFFISKIGSQILNAALKI